MTRRPTRWQRFVRALGFCGHEWESSQPGLATGFVLDTCTRCGYQDLLI